MISPIAQVGNTRTRHKLPKFKGQSSWWLQMATVISLIGICGYVWVNIPYFPIIAPCLEWAPGQKWLFSTWALKKAPGHRGNTVYTIPLRITSFVCSHMIAQLPHVTFFCVCLPYPFSINMEFHVLVVLYIVELLCKVVHKVLEYPWQNITVNKMLKSKHYSCKIIYAKAPSNHDQVVKTQNSHGCALLFVPHSSNAPHVAQSDGHILYQLYRSRVAPLSRVWLINNSDYAIL